MNIFERASRNKLRFDSRVGPLTVEQLWDLPLVSGKGTLSLNEVGMLVQRAIKSVETESLVETRPNVEAIQLELRLDIIKHVIASKQADAEATAKRAANIEKRSKLLNALADAENRELAGKSREELLKELEAIDA